MALLIRNGGDDIPLVTTPVDQVHSTQRKASTFPVNCQVIVLGGCGGVQYPVVGCDNVNMGTISW